MGGVAREALHSVQHASHSDPSTLLWPRLLARATDTSTVTNAGSGLPAQSRGGRAPHRAASEPTRVALEGRREDTNDTTPPPPPLLLLSLPCALGPLRGGGAPVLCCHGRPTRTGMMRGASARLAPRLARCVAAARALSTGAPPPRRGQRAGEGEQQQQWCWWCCVVRVLTPPLERDAGGLARCPTRCTHPSTRRGEGEGDTRAPHRPRTMVLPKLEQFLAPHLADAAALLAALASDGLPACTEDAVLESDMTSLRARRMRC